MSTMNRQQRRAFERRNGKKAPSPAVMAAADEGIDLLSKLHPNSTVTAVTVFKNEDGDTLGHREHVPGEVEVVPSLLDQKPELRFGPARLEKAAAEGTTSQSQSEEEKRKRYTDGERQFIRGWLEKYYAQGQFETDAIAATAAMAAIGSLLDGKVISAGDIGFYRHQLGIKHYKERAPRAPTKSAPLTLLEYQVRRLYELLGEIMPTEVPKEV